MPRSGGTYTLPAGNPVVTGTVGTSAWANGTMADVGSELTNSIPRDGTAPPTANMPMGSFRHTGAGAGAATTDYARLDQAQNSGLQYLTSVAGTNTITGSAPITPAAYAAGQVFRFVAFGANTAAATINVNSLGAKAITKAGTVALAGGEIVAGAITEVVYDGTQFQLLQPAVGVVGRAFTSTNTWTTIDAVTTPALRISNSVTPTISDGLSLLSLTYTPARATNRLRVRGNFFGTASVQTALVATIAQTGVANCLQASLHSIETAGFARPVYIEHEYSPGVITPVTISMRVGPTDSAIAYINGNAGGGFFAGVCRATLVLEELYA